MKVLMTGGTGFVGSRLKERLRGSGHEVSIVSRGPAGDYDWSEDSLSKGVSWCDAIIHLAGAGLFDKRWNEKRKDVLRSSRIDTTARLAELAVRHEVQAFVSTSAIGYYGASDEEGINESAPPANDFLAQLCVDWEAALAPARDAGIRCAICRIGVVLGQGGGALGKMLLPFKLGLGGPLGNGQQWFSWIHIDDLCALFQHLLENDVHGVFNGTAPNPVRFTEFAKTLGRVLKRPAFLPAPAFAVRAALGEVADVLLNGQCVLPQAAGHAGFEFSQPELEAALRDLV